MSLSAQEQDIKTQAQVEAINAEIKATQSLTSSLFPIRNLSTLFEHETSSSISNFRQGCEYLATQYNSYRAIRGDGNCYYRAFLYALCEHLHEEGADTTSTHSELKRIQEYVNKSIDQVVQCGYDRFAIETFHEEMVDLLSAVATASSTVPSSSFDKIHGMLNEENATSDYCVWYLRVLTSTYLQNDPDRFIHFLDPSDSSDGSVYFDIPSFCKKEIDPMGRECSMIGVLALAEAFGVRVDIEYLDGRVDLAKSSSSSLVKHSFGNQDGKESESESQQPLLCITLLYRPGHYDILYKKK